MILGTMSYETRGHLDASSHKYKRCFFKNLKTSHESEYAVS